MRLRLACLLLPLTLAGLLIREAGGGPVYPLALAEAAGRSGLA